MKKIEPAKNVALMPGRVTDAHCEASAATRKQVEPIANRTAIHHSGVRSLMARRCSQERRAPVRRDDLTAFVYACKL